MTTTNFTDNIQNNTPAINIQIVGDKVFTTSLNVAEVFEKQHKDVLKAISNLECSEEFSQRNFAHTPYVHSQNGQTYPAYQLTRDGFTMLAMSFTGKKAMQFKEAYIEAFNQMEAKLKEKAQQEVLPDFNNPEAMAIAWAEQHRRARVAEDKLALTTPKAETYERVVAPSRISLNSFCRRLAGVNLIAVKASLCKEGVLYRTGNGNYRLREAYRDGYFEEKYNEHYDSITLICLPKGQQLLVHLYNTDKLTMKKAFQGRNHFDNWEEWDAARSSKSLPLAI